MKADIQTRADVQNLVTTFYKKVRTNELLGPFFNETISDWDAHFDLLTTFWESSLFMTRPLEHKYQGNPIDAHIQVDQKFDEQITEMHFGVWLNLWYETIEELFQGPVADNAKRRARKMGTFIYLKIFEARQKEK